MISRSRERGPGTLAVSPPAGASTSPRVVPGSGVATTARGKEAMHIRGVVCIAIAGNWDGASATIARRPTTGMPHRVGPWCQLVLPEGRRAGVAALLA